MERYDLVFRGATVVDGSGSPSRVADVAVLGDAIAAVGELDAEGAGKVVDTAGLTLAPGFIDMHSHSDWTLLVDPAAESKVRQGVTTEVIGNCGSSPTPCVGAVVEEQERRFGRYGVEVTWRTMGQYLDRLADNGVGLNVAALVGHGAVRKAAMGFSMRAPDAAELAEMRRHVAESLEGGAIGLSTGLIYPPGCYAETEEIVELSREVGTAGRIYASHMRNEGEQLLEATAEAIRIGRESGASVQISHHKASSRRAWGLVNQSLKLIESANAEGLQVDFDQYPYRASSTGLAAMLPAWAHEGGVAALNARLRDPDSRRRLLDDLNEQQSTGIGRGIGWENVLIADCRGDRSLDGKTIAQISEERGADPAETVLDVLLASECDVGTIYFSMSEDDVRTVMRHPLMTVGSDSSSRVIGGRSDEGKPHPRTFGTFARILGQYVREEGVLSWEDAIRKMSGRPAEKLGLTDRGTIEVGKRADLVLFDPASVRETATYEEPRRYPEGVRLVVVNGRVAVDGDRHTGTLAGRVLRPS
jgi:N-acyl-D-amino-acid deacylase